MKGLVSTIYVRPHHDEFLELVRLLIAASPDV